MNPRPGFAPFFLMATLLMTAAAAVAATEAPKDLAAEVAAAQALESARKLPEARAAFERILTVAPENAAANCAITFYELNQGKWESALKHAERCVAAEPNNARYQYAWGAANGLAALRSGVLSKFGHAKKCLAAYQRAAELDPQNLQYHWALLNYYQQAPGFAGGSVELAYAQAAEIAKIDPMSGRRARAQLHMSQKRFAEAFQEFDGLWVESSDDLRLHYEFGRLTLMSAQRLDEGLTAFRRCLALTPAGDGAKRARADAHWRIGSVWERKGQPEPAREEYLAALKELPDFRQAKQALENLGNKKS